MKKCMLFIITHFIFSHLMAMEQPTTGIGLQYMQYIDKQNVDEWRSCLYQNERLLKRFQHQKHLLEQAIDKIRQAIEMMHRKASRGEKEENELINLNNQLLESQQEYASISKDYEDILENIKRCNKILEMSSHLEEEHENIPLR